MGRVEKAIEFATKAHEGQKRKGKDIPYILHPLNVGSIVSRYTNDEDVIIAAILHDVIEDTNATKEQIEEMFGKRVVDLVLEESENKRKDIPADETWETRKKERITRLKESTSSDSKLICLADKVSNISEIADDYNEIGDNVWERFNQKDPQKIVKYYSDVFDVLKDEFSEMLIIKDYEAKLHYLQKAVGLK